MRNVTEKDILNASCIKPKNQTDGYRSKEKLDYKHSKQWDSKTINRIFNNNPEFKIKKQLKLTVQNPRTMTIFWIIASLKMYLRGLGWSPLNQLKWNFTHMSLIEPSFPLVSLLVEMPSLQVSQLDSTNVTLQTEGRFMVWLTASWSGIMCFGFQSKKGFHYFDH